VQENAVLRYLFGPADQALPSQSAVPAPAMQNSALVHETSRSVGIWTTARGTKPASSAHERPSQTKAWSFMSVAMQKRALVHETENGLSAFGLRSAGADQCPSRSSKA
jgi:hypothetical protein